MGEHAHLRLESRRAAVLLEQARVVVGGLLGCDLRCCGWRLFLLLLYVLCPRLRQFCLIQFRILNIVEIQLIPFMMWVIGFTEGR